VGKVSQKKEKKKLGGVQGENKVPPKKKKKLRSELKKGKHKKSEPGMARG
jgi:hypothetical protein